MQNLLFQHCVIKLYKGDNVPNFKRILISLQSQFFYEAEQKSTKNITLLTTVKPLASNKNFISARVQKPSERSELTLCSLNVKCPQTTVPTQDFNQ